MMRDQQELYPVNPATLIQRFHDDVHDSVRTLCTAIDPVSKELRTFPVEPAPCLLREIASNLIRADTDHYFRLSMMYPYDFDSDNWTKRRTHADFIVPSASARKRYMDSVYKMVEPCLETRPGDSSLVVSLSRKTMILQRPIRDLITDHISSLQALNGGVAVDLSELLYYMEPGLYTSAFPAMVPRVELDHPFLERLYNATIYRVDVSEQSLTDILRGWNRTEVPFDQLVMKTKTYINRADTRAYYVDKCKTRHLCGAILQTILNGNSLRERQELTFEEVMPAKGKNVLDVTLDVEEDGYILLLFGDISSFTNSCVNSWVLVLALLTTVLSHDTVRHLRHPFRLRVNGFHMSATLEVVLLMFLFSSVGIPASTPHGPHYATGGYLGVKSNIVSTLLFFCILLDETQIQALTLFEDVRVLLTRVGGDDFALAFFSTEITSLRRIQEYYRQQIVCYIGALKEFNCTLMHSTSEGVFTANGLYCKKHVTVRVERKFPSGARFLIRSQQKLPFMGELLEDFHGLDPGERKRRLVGFTSSLHNLLRGFEREQWFHNAYMHAFIRLHEVPEWLQTVPTFRVVSSGDLRKHGDVLCLPTAYAFMTTVVPLYTARGVKMRYTSKERKAFLIGSEVLESESVFIDIVSDTAEEVLAHPLDQKMITILRMDPVRYRLVDSPGIDFVYNLVLEARNRLSHLIN